MNLNNKKLYNIKIFIILIFIMILGFLLRIWGINKESGMWGDEVFSFILAKSSLMKILTTKEWNPPLYYFILHFWIKLFGKEDIILRMLSVLLQTFSVFIIYLAGKELHTRKTGLLAAFFVSFNSLLIYYSQEVRPYALTTLFASLILLMIIKIYKKPSTVNFLLLATANIGLLYTHSLSFIFVFFEYLFFGIFLYIKNRNLIKQFFYSICAVFTVYFPYFFYVILNMAGSVNMTWGKTSFADLGFTVTDLFSPLLMNRYGSTNHLYNIFFKTNGITPYFVSLIIFSPLIISLIGIYFSVKQKKTPVLIFLLTGLFFILIIGYESIFGKIVLCTRYIIEAAPVFILASAYGLRKIKLPYIRKFLILIFTAINLFYLILCGTSAPKLDRAQGFMPAIKTIQDLKIKNNDKVIVFWFDKNYFEKYYDFGKTEVFAVNQETYFNYLSPLNNLKTITESDLYDKLKPVLTSKQNKYSDKIFKEKFINRLLSNNRLIIIVYDTFIKEDKNGVILNSITKNDKLYKSKNIYDLTYIKLNGILLNLCDKEMKFSEKKQTGAFSIYVYKKP